MAERSKGLLLAMMEPPAAFEEEFNDWYDTEHLPERKAIKGFETAHRFVCVDGFPKYVAVYDLSYLEVLDEPAYRAVAYVRFSPWTKRVQTKTRGRYRATAQKPAALGAPQPPPSRRTDSINLSWPSPDTPD